MLFRKRFYSRFKMCHLNKAQPETEINSRAEKQEDRKGNIAQRRDSPVPFEIGGKFPEKI